MVWRCLNILLWERENKNKQQESGSSAALVPSLSSLDISASIHSSHPCIMCSFYWSQRQGLGSNGLRRGKFRNSVHVLGSPITLLGMERALLGVVISIEASLHHWPAQEVLNTLLQLCLAAFPDLLELLITDGVGAIHGVRDAGVWVGPVDLELAVHASSGGRLAVLGILAIGLLVVLSVVGLCPSKLLLPSGAIQADVTALCQDLLIGWSGWLRLGCLLVSTHWRHSRKAEEQSQGHASD